jgi:hypothetical protein
LKSRFPWRNVQDNPSDKYRETSGEITREEEKDAGSSPVKNRLRMSLESANALDQGKLQFFEDDHEKNGGQGDNRKSQEDFARYVFVLSG